MTDCKTGKRYTTETGRVVTIIRHDPDSVWPLVGDDWMCYSAAGMSCLGIDEDRLTPERELTTEEMVARYEMEWKMFEAQAALARGLQGCDAAHSAAYYGWANSDWTWTKG